MQKYIFNKNIKKNGFHFQLEIILPCLFYNLKYKIYGEEGFFYEGELNIHKNNSLDNIIIILFEKIQNMFIHIEMNNQIYFDFLNICEEEYIKKNIKLDIKRKFDITKDKSNIILDNIIVPEKKENCLFNYFKKEENNDISSDEEDTDEEPEDEK